jgi:hypothetical protein
MTKQHILSEIRRTARTNGGLPFGKRRFFTETGVKETDWRGIYWTNWSDALEEAGFSRNKLQAAYSADDLIAKYVAFVRELGHLPVNAELMLKRRSDPTFPSEKTFRRLGNKSQLAAKALKFCRERDGFGDVAAICLSVGAFEQVQGDETGRKHKVVQTGFVYLVKSGRHYKIGRSNAVGRREYELAIQLPTRVTKVHEIATDDPVGIEAYWHKRFADQRGNGEWFELSSDDVMAFKRRKFM